MMLLLLACSFDDPSFGEGGNRTDPDGSGTSNLTDDSAQDSGPTPHTGDTEPTSDCGGDDLDFSFVIRDGSGNDGTALSYGTVVSSVAVFANGCKGTVKFSTADSCLVSEWTLGGAEDVSFSGNCVEEVTNWEVAEGDAVEVAAEWGVLDRGNWFATATSAIDGSTQTAFFTIQ
jgi:hypothetical protein